MEQGWIVGLNILRLIIVLLLASATEAVTNTIGKEYPAAALQADSCFSTSCTVAGLYDVALTYKVTFSSMDSRWNYSPKNIFNKDVTMHPGQWEEGLYNCDPVLATVSSCTFRAATGATIVGGTPDSYAGEFVRLDLSTAASTWNTMTFWATDRGRPLRYRLYGTTDPSQSTIVWTKLVEQDDVDQDYNGGTVISKTWTAAAYKTFVLIVKRVQEPSYNARSTLQLYELAFSSSTATYCPTHKYVTGGDCVDCPTGKYSESIDATSITGCLKQCIPGTYMPNSDPTTCMYCPAGKYSIDGLVRPCTDCPLNSGTYSPTVGAKTIDTCIPCPLGRAPSTDKSECKICPAGTQRSVAATDTCTTCGDGLMSAAGSSVVCAGACLAGSYQSTVNVKECLPCPAGKAGVACVSICSTNKFSGAGATGCLNCPAGSYSPTSDTYGNPTCTYCEMGKYAVSDGTINTCVSCAAGKSTFYEGVVTTSAIGANICTVCPKGKFSTEGTQCTDCPPGTISGSTGQATCTQCGAGEYAEAGKTICTQCAPEYTSAPGAGTCKIPENFAQPW